MSRIISGAAGGVRLASVPGDNTRPTTDRVKESLFSKLESYDIIRGARVLDAFGGSGALGCEALSRGAASVTLLDIYPKAVAVIRKNVAAVEKAMGRTGSSSTRVQQSQALTYVKSASGPWDLVFVDPPYAMPNEQVSELLEALTPKLAEGAVVVVERSSRDEEPVWGEGLYCFSTRQHGETVLYYVEPDEAEEQAGDESGANLEPGEDVEELAA
ncbi:16S rRNA (guanine(966)-N(2))-methyltransferase RsmD [Rothia sp. (in: high G+C Gram-positive bacteria)]|uniref:16S rRNA (guanine(966)-N(2))-methyltransferase RsmD n=1 Tax=Rothia sp. (in: high G+C Gram-positive bacteria) TaxID=1885016 RepID=UPI0025DBBF55|nr:16S rRNA (guanine(966)-N(2))-methyltransferase RsmD [Rothia sp. (in: high G+C Gram-positive bacteria)]